MVPARGRGRACCGGRIITIGSTGGDRIVLSSFSDYAATKGAVAAYTTGWARDLGPKRITVNVVQPGPVDTDMNPEAPNSRPP